CLFKIPQELIDLHIKLLRKSRKTVSNERWEKAIIKICHGFCIQDAWEIERFGYKKARLSSKLRVLKELLEMQFDYNARFKAEINKMDREGLVCLINELSNGDSKFSSESAVNEEDSNSLVEKPIIDTGQVDSSSSDSNKKSPEESENSNESKKSDNISPPREKEESEEEEEEEEKLASETSKRSRESDGETGVEEAKKAKVEVSEAIEEPVVLVEGEGEGAANECVDRIEDDPIVGEEIEEDVMYFYGCGGGVDCETGNEDKEAKKTDADGESELSEKSTPKDSGDSENFVSISVSDSKNCVDEVDGSSKEVPTSPVKSPFRLGTIIDTKTDNNKFFNATRSPTKKSRWDVETIIAKEPEDGAKPDAPKKSMFFFGPGCLQFGPVSCSATVAFGQKVPQTSSEERFETAKTDDECVNRGLEVIPSNTKGDIGYRIVEEDNKEVESVETIECVQSGGGAGRPETPIESRVESKLEETKADDDHDRNRNVVSEAEAALEQEIVPEGRDCDVKIPAEETQKLPEVTAALVGCEEEGQSTKAEEEKADEPSRDDEPAPVVEEECVKKHAYLLGEEETEPPKEESEETKANATEIEEKIANHEPETASNVSITTKVESCTALEEDRIKEETEDDPQPVDDNKSNCLSEKEEKSVKDEPERETVNNKNARGRKNNASDEQPKTTRRTTRSSKNEEKPEKTNDDAKLTDSTEISAVKDEKNSEMKTETEMQPRRGRSRTVFKEEPVEEDASKKMKMSGDGQEEAKVKQNKAREEETRVEEEKEAKSPKFVEETVASGNSSDAVDAPEKDPLAVSEEEAPKEAEEKPVMSLSTFSLDFNESPTPTPPLTRRGLRKRGRESPQNCEEVEETSGKRPKMKGKRNIDVKLRKSIEEQKKQELVSSDDDKNEQPSEQAEEKGAKKKGSKHKKVEAKNEEAVVVSSDAEAEIQKEKKKNVNKNKRLLSNLGIKPEEAFDFGQDSPVGVRQSRRIAQLKIKEEAERRKLEEEVVHDPQKKKKSKKSKDKDYKVDKKKLKHDDDDDEPLEEDSGDSKKKKRKSKKKKQKKLFDEYNPWRSSSDSSSSDEEEDDEICEESDDEILQYVSDHEFSPESDMEGDGEALPLKRARTARKESDVEEVDDCPCQKCGKSDHPEWILLCDKCDNGWHCSCLRPPLLVIPEGDWFCPPCQHVTLLKKLQEKLKEYDKRLRKKELEDRRKQRLAYVGISLNSVLPAKDTEVVKKRRRKPKENEDDEQIDAEEEEDEDSSSSEESESVSGSESGSDSDEPIYQLRQRRQAHSYRFNDYDELINSAIQEEMEAVKGAGNQGRGKDISTIVNAEKEEERKKESETPGEEQAELPEPLPPVVPPDDKDKEAKPLYSDDEPVQGVKKKIIGRKKHRKLNSLDISSADDDEDSDEDFKGTSSESDDDFEDDLGSEDSEDLDSGRNRRRNIDPVRRSTRARTSRYDADFSTSTRTKPTLADNFFFPVDDGDSEDEEEAPRRKKKRSIWDDSESEESDRSWGRRKRKPTSKQKKTNTASKKKKSKKKKKDNDDSDAEVYRKKKPKIKFGLDGEDESPGRRTRGKKINYVDALGSDSDEDRVKRPPPRIESEEEYVANEDDEFDEDDKVTDEEEGDSGEERAKAPKIQIQSYADARFTQLLPEGVPTPKDLYLKNQVLEDGDDEPNPIDQINRNVEMMDENEMEKMMEEEEYANKQLQLVALQLEKEKRRKEREAKKLEGLLPPQLPQDQNAQKKRGRKPKNQFQFSGSMQEPIVGNVDSLIVNSENNDELSEPPGVSLPLFAELGAAGDGMEDPAKKRRGNRFRIRHLLVSFFHLRSVFCLGRGKKSLEEAVANLGSARQQESAFMAMANKEESNIEIAAPPQPFSQSQPTPSVITRMLQSKPGQPGYPIGTIRPKQFASMPEREEEVMAPSPAHHGQYLQGDCTIFVLQVLETRQPVAGAGMRPQLSSPYRQMPPNMNHYPRGAPPHQIRNPVPSHIYHSHRPLDPSPSGGGTINMTEHNSPGRVVSPASSSPGSNKNETPPPPYSRPPVGRFPPISASAGPRHLHMVAPHLQPPRPNLSPYHPSMPPSYHYGQFGQPLGGTEDAMPPTVYQNSPYSEQFPEGQVNQSENSNSKSFDEESGGEFGGLVSYFSSQREDDLES
ncbi:remodeling and spacing factor 1-like, partial [Asbolus verrucosus]